MVIASDGNSSGVLFALGECKLLTGSIDEAIPLGEQAIRLDPRDPSVWNRYLAIGKVHLLQSRIEEAIVSLEKARIGNPGSPWPHLWLASAYALEGETERAGAQLADARRLLGAGSFSSIAQVMAHGYWGVPKTRALFEATYLVGLRKAGCRKSEAVVPAPLLFLIARSRCPVTRRPFSRLSRPFRRGFGRVSAALVIAQIPRPGEPIPLIRIG